MPSQNNTADFFKEANQAQFNLLLDQLKIVDERMSRDFPEVDFKVKIDSHVDAKTLTVEMTFLTSNEMSDNDRLFKKLEWVCTETQWNNPKMITSISKLSDLYMTTIATAINRWYAQRKEKDEHGVA